MTALELSGCASALYVMRNNPKFPVQRRRLYFSDSRLPCCQVTKISDINLPLIIDTDISFKERYRLDSIGEQIIGRALQSHFCALLRSEDNDALSIIFRFDSSDDMPPPFVVCRSLA